MPTNHYRLLFLLLPPALLVSFIATTGCRMTAPVHVWTPPELESVVGKRVGIAEVEGPSNVTRPIREKMLAMSPADTGRSLVALDIQRAPRSLDTKDDQVIQLASATEPVDQNSNDVAPPINQAGNIEGRAKLDYSNLDDVAKARRLKLDYVLRGEVISKGHQSISKPSGPRMTKADFNPNDPVRVSWRLLSVKDNRPVGGKPVVIDGITASKRYPDLASQTNPNDALLTALVRESYRLVTPSTRKTNVQLAIPYATPGSRQTRQANQLASQGRWGEAELIWQEVSDRHPTQVAAIHNLALAAAAGQDFSRAKKLARTAIRRNPAPLHQQTLVWIEKRQRDYHQAFNLPDPPEGWFVSREVAGNVR